jgi:hypothetical protein
MKTNIKRDVSRLHLTRAGVLGLLGVCLAVSVPTTASGEGTWIPLANTAPGGVETMLLMTDGTVLAQNGGGATWYRLKPDAYGHYVGGTWPTSTSMHFTRKYYSSDVMRDSRVFIAGAEYGTGTTNAEIYDPLGGSWTVIPIPDGIINKNNTVRSDNSNTGGFVDSPSVLLNNGQILISPVAPAVAGRTTTYDPATGSWSTAKLVRGSNEDEAGWVKLPDDSILTVDTGGYLSERYLPALNIWTNDANVPVGLYDPYGTELGPAFLLPNGKAFYIGSTPTTAYYTPSGNNSPGSWVQGPAIPNNLGAPDAPGAMMVNGKILCELSPTPTSGQHFPSPKYFYEFDYSAGANGTFRSFTHPTGHTRSTPRPTLIACSVCRMARSCIPTAAASFTFISPMARRWPPRNRRFMEAPGILTGHFT